tara:strand:- start:321 stop:803 length:483 start_codon:yes stop_codon:yes gene_type:complete
LDFHQIPKNKKYLIYALKKYFYKKIIKKILMCYIKIINLVVRIFKYINRRFFMSDFTVEFTEQNFTSEVESSEIPVLVDFWAEWCGPCKLLSPTIDVIAEKYSGKIKVGKVNVDQNSTIAQKYGVRGIPNILIFANGSVQDQLIGNVPESDISKVLDELV